MKIKPALPTCYAAINVVPLEKAVISKEAYLHYPTKVFLGLINLKL